MDNTVIRQEVSPGENTINLKPDKKAKAQKKNKNANNTIPHTATESIPYEGVYQNGIIEPEPYRFSKSYRVPEVNFTTSTNDNQYNLFEMYQDFLNSFDASVDIELTLYNRTINIEEFRKQIFIPMKNDNLNDYREEYNKMLTDKMVGIRNNLITEKILTITVAAEDIFAANEKFSQIDAMIADSMATMAKASVKPMTITERMELLYSIYNPDATRPLYEKRVINGHEVESFSLENCARQGISTKDVIAPSVIEFDKNYGKIDGKMVKSYFVKNYPTWIKGSIFTDFTELPTNMLVSIHLNAMDQSEAIKMVKRQGTNISTSILEAEKKAARSGYSHELISPDLKAAKEEANELMDKITKDNAKLFTTTFVFTLYADDAESLKGFEEQLYLIGNKNLLTINPLNQQQENGFATALPIGNKKVSIDRLMTSTTVSCIIPFDVKDIKQEDGMYYGVNAVSKNMILYNRASGMNPNSCILGMPGSGKSFAAKREIINVLLNTGDEVYIIDPEREYKPLADAFDGTVVKIANGSDKYINPFDLNIKNTDDEGGGDPVKIKCDFIETICEIMVGGKYGLSAITKSIIGRSVFNIYNNYIEYLKKTGLDQDFDHTPTMRDFYDDLMRQEHPEAIQLAFELERFVKGALDVFSHRTSLNVQNRFTVYDIKDIGPGLKELGLQVCLDNIWNKMIENKAKGKRTWIYIDEFHFMMQKPSSAAYISQIWKRARKWNGYPCAITQNVEDMLKSEDARTVINNCAFITLLGQSPLNKQQLSEMMGISPEEQKYISAAKPGTGLICVNNDFIPMNDEFPSNTKLYKIMTTNPDET